MLICSPFLSNVMFFLIPVCLISLTGLSFLPLFCICCSHCGISMHSPAVSGYVSWLRPRSPSPEMDYKRLTWGLNVVKMTCWQLKWIACHMSFFFSSPLVNSAIRMHTICERNLEDIQGCKLSCRHHLNSQHRHHFSLLFYLFFFLALPSRLWMVSFCSECRRKNKW